MIGDTVIQKKKKQKEVLDKKKKQKQKKKHAKNLDERQYYNYVGYVYWMNYQKSSKVHTDTRTKHMNLIKRCKYRIVIFD